MITGINFIEALELFKADEQTKAIVLIGEIGGNLEELTAEYIDKTHYPKPIVAYVAGRAAPTEKRMGHAGAIIMGNTGTARSKVQAFENVGVRVADKPSDVTELIASVLRR
jgi:succinyl-CoA synthetase alpha subunit